MKKFFIAMICFMLCITGVVGAVMLTTPSYVNVSAVETKEVNKITVTGNGEVKLTPDTAIISLGVETLDQSLELAQKTNSEKVNSLIAALKELGVSEENIKTKNFYVYQRYDYSKGEEFLGYQVSNYLDFKTKDIDNVSSIITKLLESGANRFNGISFTLEDEESAYNMALERALENAKSKASAITNLPYTSFEVCEDCGYNCYAREMYSLSSFSKDSTSIMKGEICVKASIKVTFEY